MYDYIKALHIIFVVTWFAGLFYMPRLFIYNVEASERSGQERSVLRKEFSIMMTRLWFGITWPSALLTLVFGGWVLFHSSRRWYNLLDDSAGLWLLIKLAFVLLLYVYHYSLHKIYNQQMAGVFKYSSNQLRVWNEVATVFLIAIVMLATVKQSISIVWGLIGLIIFIAALMAAIKMYKRIRERSK